jgi:hypothetical protein
MVSPVEIALLALLGILWGMPYALTKIALTTILPIHWFAASQWQRRCSGSSARGAKSGAAGFAGGLRIKVASPGDPIHAHRVRQQRSGARLHSEFYHTAFVSDQLLWTRLNR